MRYYFTGILSDVKGGNLARVQGLDFYLFQIGLSESTFERYSYTISIYQPTYTPIISKKKKTSY